MAFDKKDYESLLQFRMAIRKYIHFVDEGARAVGITPQQHQLMLAVKGQKGKDWASVSEVAEALQLKHNSAVGLATRCQAAGLIEKEAFPGDHRIVRICLTEKGENILAELSQRNIEQLQTLNQAMNLLVS